MPNNNKLTNQFSTVSEIKTFEKRKHSDIPTLEVKINSIAYIRKDINMIQLPFFYFSDKKQYEVIRYKFGSDESKQMIVQAAALDKVPTTFEFEVVQVLLKFREAYKKANPGKEMFTCKAWDIARELGMIYRDKNGKVSLSKKEKDRIVESIERLKKTSYTLLNLYNVKTTAAQGEKAHYERQEKVIVNMLDSLSIDEDLFHSESTFHIKFHDLFIRSIENKYHFTYELAKLDQIKKPTPKRFFELIDFRRNRQMEAEFEYSEIAWAIPIRSGRNNRILINGYLDYLTNEVKVIAGFSPDSKPGFFGVKFLPDTKNNYNVITSGKESDHSPKVTEIITAERNAEYNNQTELFPLTDTESSIKELLLQHNNTLDLKTVLDFFEKSNMNLEEFKGSLEYTLKKKPAKFFAYLEKVISNGYADAYLADKKEDLRQTEIKASKIEQEQQSKTEEEAKQKREEEKYLAYFNALPQAKQEKLRETAAAKAAQIFRGNSELREIAIWEEIKEMLATETVI